MKGNTNIITEHLTTKITLAHSSRARNCLAKEKKEKNLRNDKNRSICSVILNEISILEQFAS